MALPEVNPLEYVLTEDLLHELQRRYSVMIFAGVSEWDEANVEHKVAVKGEWLHLLGLASLVEHDLRTRWDEDKDA